MTEPTTRPAAAPERPRAHPPETTEGWYAFHQILTLDRAALRALPSDARARLRDEADGALNALATPAEGGWSAVVPLIGSRADVMLVHFRPSLDDIGAAQRAVARIGMFDAMKLVYSFLSVTE